jgi:hypothetical protein
MKNPKMEQIHSRTKSLIYEINTLQKRMIDEAEGNTPSAHQITKVSLTEKDPGINYELLTRPFQLSAGYLMPGSSLREELNSSLREYMNYVSSLSSENEFQNYENLLDPSLILQSGDSQKDITLMAALHSMELLKNSLLAFESYALKLIAKT